RSSQRWPAVRRLANWESPRQARWSSTSTQTVRETTAITTTMTMTTTAGTGGTTTMTTTMVTRTTTMMTTSRRAAAIRRRLVSLSVLAGSSLVLAGSWVGVVRFDL